MAPAPGLRVDEAAPATSCVPATSTQPQVEAAERRDIEPLRGVAAAKHARGRRTSDTFVGLAKRLGKDVKGDELWVLAPAFITTELREAFAIAILIFVPFLVIDLVVGLGLACARAADDVSRKRSRCRSSSLLFVAVDGWRLLLESLLRGYCEGRMTASLVASFARAACSRCCSRRRCWSPR